MRFYNVLTYCTSPSCTNEAKYAYISDGVLMFTCKECRSRLE